MLSVLRGLYGRSVRSVLSALRVPSVLCVRSVLGEPPRSRCHCPSTPRSPRLVARRAVRRCAGKERGRAPRTQSDIQGRTPASTMFLHTSAASPRMPHTSTCAPAATRGRRQEAGSREALSGTPGSACACHWQTRADTPRPRASQATRLGGTRLPPASLLARGADAAGLQYSSAGGKMLTGHALLCGEAPQTDLPVVLAVEVGVCAIRGHAREFRARREGSSSASLQEVHSVHDSTLQNQILLRCSWHDSLLQIIH